MSHFELKHDRTDRCRAVSVCELRNRHPLTVFFGGSDERHSEELGKNMLMVEVLHDACLAQDVDITSSAAQPEERDGDELGVV